MFTLDNESSLVLLDAFSALAVQTADRIREFSTSAEKEPATLLFGHLSSSARNLLDIVNGQEDRDAIRGIVAQAGIDLLSASLCKTPTNDTDKLYRALVVVTDDFARLEIRASLSHP